ncbi:hypothetical protein HNR63_002331 [Anoxybacillus kamchatkensis]|uniref:nucleotidyltransferase substrate binding protein n=1 Tax=Anoxybacillus ayderensis TaxID=265546 RepID=UPI0015EC5166|nr:hypothetical protein [Anoxybacillus ayderensis]
MSHSLENYKESIVLSYQYAFRLLLHLKNVIAASKQIPAEDGLMKEVYRDSIVKKYEILEDQLWKLLSKIFKASGLELHSPRACYRQAFKEGWIEHIDIWNDMLSSHANSACQCSLIDEFDSLNKEIARQIERDGIVIYEK